MTAALVQGLQLLGREQLESTPGLFPALLTGVSVRLDSPEGPLRHVHTNKFCSVNILVECKLVGIRHGRRGHHHVDHRVHAFELLTSFTSVMLWYVFHRFRGPVEQNRWSLITTATLAALICISVLAQGESRAHPRAPAQG